MTHFETQSAKFILPDDYHPKIWKIYIINHDNGQKTYVAHQTKSYKALKEKKSTYFVDVDNKNNIIG